MTKDEMTQKEAESLVKRIKKLMLLSTSKNENESAAAASKAQELLLKYNIDISEVENVSLDPEDLKVRKEFIDIFGAEARNRIQWKRDLAWVVAKHNLCKGVASGTGMWFVGKKANIEVSRFMYETVMADLIRIGDEKWKQILLLRDLEIEHNALLFTDPTLRTVHGKTWKASFYVGAIKTIRERLDENLTALQLQSGKITALVKRDLQENEEFARKEFHLVNTSYSRASVISAYETGRKAGTQVQFKRGIGAGGAHGGPSLLGDGR